MAIIIKNQEQIEGIRKSSQLAGHTLNFIAPYVKPGVNTEYLDNLIEQFMRDHGAIPATLNYNGYPKSSCISPNNVICHGIPSKEMVLKEGDIVNIDVTTILNGYYGDTSRMFQIGEISKEANDLLEATKHCLNLGIQQVRPGNYFGNIGYVISRYAQAKGYSVVYEFCGHGVGIQFHEDPQVDHIARKNTGAIMKPGMIFTIEPMINMGKARVSVDKHDGWTARTVDNKLSAQYEHTVLVTAEGVEVLTDVDGMFSMTPINNAAL
ncbi:MAG TPA: type I methionyl aminopeptidase [Marinilabiliales bacterium]|jgi:methionyl aminopeptidase|nr:MAG: type I methionyl aminopeptidase [Bacteroidetes bacterium GWA2_40_14]OFX60897.1 MAG: type I methionyl aminopeptidase [Bacteroidetes bacterium GWC2_40_13]OFX71552.1 MAG: type I methionyl aminopeptidase [Bacteroidetes bacterium GWD2_40_43]OFX95586.1 MAG: type I methionyl aminopeptidase [Bacteroidetes bacterium GWE2_40_63]OFY22256.1 MAG: type I methionyl aminopeptidase [Bacteroidetes bacterium GWF2_40_13]OFZ24893.1 MAG: type I methionyl aminopeptidase [Bacteroidetes bacterium RIFOXYC2_FULL